MLPENVKVLIVGAGPTGLALSIALRQADIDHLIVDRLEAGLNTSRAAVIHAHTLEMLEPLGVVDELERRGRRLQDFSVRDGDRALLRLNFDGLPTRFNHILMIPQQDTEAVLADRLAALGGRVHRGVSAMSVAKRGDGYEVRLATTAGDCTVSADYVVAGDGMHSTVRQDAGIGFDGDSYADSFVLADVSMNWKTDRDEVAFYLSPEGPVVVAPLPDGRFRVVATRENAPERPDAALIEEIMNSRGPKTRNVRIGDVSWSSRFRLHHRVASAYRAGNIFLMGDAAHVHSPAGGQGMNTGLVDAVVLAGLLTAVLKHGRPGSDLDKYEALRRPAAEQVLALADRLTRVALVRGFWGKLLRTAIFGLLNLSPAFKRGVQLSLSGLDRRRFTELA
ncbi:MAG: FAD-dependent monooxygenase [Rhizobium sp.]|nr:FAD-dependent monooxygenase [Rhizobium sp.]